MHKLQANQPKAPDSAKTWAGQPEVTRGSGGAENTCLSDNATANRDRINRIYRMPGD